jgi:hypothetical protein
MPNRFSEDRLLQAIGAVALLGGYSIKKVSTGDDLKVRTVTIALETASSGWVQDSLVFDREPEATLEVTATSNGEVLSIKALDPSDLTETDETGDAAPPQLSDAQVAGIRSKGR